MIINFKRLFDKKIKTKCTLFEIRTKEAIEYKIVPTNSCYLPANSSEIVAVPDGYKISFLGNGNVSIFEIGSN